MNQSGYLKTMDNELKNGLWIIGLLVAFLALLAACGLFDGMDGHKGPERMDDAVERRLEGKEGW